MSFLKSPQVRAGLVEIHELQEEIMKAAMTFPKMDMEEQYEHIELLEELLEKQRLMYTRISLSDDPEAKQLKEDLIQSVGLLGLQQDLSPPQMFDMMQSTIANLRKVVENHLDNQ